MISDHSGDLALIFDFGGVLVDWDPRHLYRKLFRGDEAAMERFLEEVHFAEWNLQQDAGRPFAQAVDALCAEFPQYCELIRAYDTRWEESIKSPIEDSVKILYTLKELGCSLHGLSNWSVEKFELARHKYEFFDWFETILISGEVGINKPDPRIFQIMLERVQRQPTDCLLIDDSLRNIETAYHMRFHTIHFRSPEQLRTELETRGILKGN